MFTLTAGMEISQITLVESCETSKAILDKLDSVYQQKSEFNKMMILDRFHQVKMNSNESIAQHVAKVENLARQVKESGESLSDIAIITKILSILPTKYRSFRQAWLSLAEDKQTLCRDPPSNFGPTITIYLFAGSRTRFVAINRVWSLLNNLTSY